MYLKCFGYGFDKFEIVGRRRKRWGVEVLWVVYLLLNMLVK